MASYMILTPPGARADDDRARFVADGFSWGAFLFPALWLFAKRMWLFGIAVAVLQILLISLSVIGGGLLAALLLHLALGLMVSLEGPVFIARRLIARNWTVRSIVPARDLETAEEIYFANVAPADRKAAERPSVDWPRQAPANTGPGLGLFESYGER
ncbi:MULTISPECIES: DUF2628 domain-containing protein [Ensifer]|uniref:DUF2628 domain-containing protein n=1 Tax=Ensifer canadensis TaxID=555315 RepID=A0AAW4FT71_9HYPH|nr:MULTISPECIES: DUF2628 domain-containing protein [Ensifer]KQW50604.1 hypothetical protein ASD02_08810 [Ensifer sp. Root1252]MDP9632894.1 hypothetical protein [Ensifer adhaerens]PSS61097.1 DUF2628 domain-containing protein [Ensifer sp. NM-2]KQU92750.1 hypothetical protein ASD00_24890 [Ensifer sp. Root31]KQW67731.1 hypothetical protein ASD03_12535 [Ensifer sp. Root127]